MNLDEIAIRVAEGMPNGFIFSEPCDHETGILISEVTEFARRLLAEVQKLQEPVAWIQYVDKYGDYELRQHKEDCRNHRDAEPLYKALEIET